MEMKSFKTAAFGGFDKQDVLNAFEELSREYKKEKEEMQKEITQLKAKRFEAVTQLEKLKAGDKDRSDLIGKLQLLIKKQNADNDKLKQLNIAVEKHAKEIKTQNEQLQKRLQDVEGRTANETARLKKFDESGYTAERILSEANARSASTLADANNRASLILTEAAKKASANIAQSTKRAEEIIAKAEEEAEKLKLAAQDYNHQAQKRISDRETELADKEKRTTIRSGEIIREANARADEIVKSAKIKADKANEEYTRFAKQLESMKLSIFEVMQQIHNQVDGLEKNMPNSLQVDDVLQTEVKQDEFLTDQLFKEQMLKEGILKAEDLQEETEKASEDGSYPTPEKTLEELFPEHSDSDFFR
ncbi:Uncharacterised protein [uncultured Ruminococcus sp.]|uniref:Uncharacterized protein n=1 Tax=Massiliimalia timonensis TaxID=1987501 RepID=A0A8J6TV63_9FIRM|nr:hypothetical protein [Massiliimalia timonensis]MBC8611173.1 hypothetical protein [Massiliimalia timonensis]MBS7174808.1 hypothetical protein [Clostridiales bacterium]SCI07032.1 Uncharacterised protein [uncultured Clostridium sp.]SCI37744.1 Uncharacterised protein [uncultured Ruminococcus sp.]